MKKKKKKAKNKKKKFIKNLKSFLFSQKAFNFGSLIFILVCLFWYGGRFIYYYLDSEKTITEEENTVARVLKTSNNDGETFKQYNTSYYFYGDADSNYVIYSNILWRVIKINSDNTVTMISDSILSTLSFGENTTYLDSPILKWLNDTDDETGVLESKLNDIETYLVKNSTCIDNVDDVNDIACDNENSDNYINLLSVDDYINTGGTSSFINNGKYSYLSNMTSENEIWYINTDGKLDTSTGEDIYGVKAVITLNSNVEITSGTGSESDPYLLGDNTNFFGSYVKLGDDVWIVYDEDETYVKLILNDYLTIDGEKLEYSYSEEGYYHNDTAMESLAYYLNHTYLDSLSYSDLIVETSYSNGYYGIESDYDYSSTLMTTIETKVALPSVGNIILNDNLDGYFTDTGISENSSLIYVYKNTGTLTNKNVNTTAYVVPCISILKSELALGSGSIDDPYRTE